MSVSLRRVEHLDNFRDARRVTSQQRNCWIIFKPEGGFINDYLSGHKCIAFMRAKTSGRDTIQNGFILEASPVGRKATTPCSYICSRNNRISLQKSVMLSQDVETMEGVKRFIPSRVRFERFDTGDFSLGKSLFLFDAFQVSNKTRTESMNGKMGFGIRFYAVALGECGGEQIKSTTNGVNHRSNVCINQWVKRLIGISHKELAAIISGIRLYDEAIWLSLLPSFKSFLQSWNIGYGPLDGGLNV